MRAVRRESKNALPSDSRGHLYTSVTFMRPYALRMQPYALIMHFLPEIEKPIKSRAERTSEEPYALYAPLLGVGPFFAFFLLRELHTVHKTAYGWSPEQALALLPVGIEALPACRNQKCIRKCIRIFADFGRKCPPTELICPCPPSSLTDTQGVFCPCTPFFGPSDGLSSFWAIVVGIRFAPCRRGRQGFDFQATTLLEIKKPPET